jgi:hypothetical protein
LDAVGVDIVGDEQAVADHDSRKLLAGAGADDGGSTRLRRRRPDGGTGRRTGRQSPRQALGDVLSRGRLSLRSDLRSVPST